MRVRPIVSPLVFISGVLLSAGAAVGWELTARDDARTEFEADARELQAEMEARLSTLVALLRGGAGLHATQRIASDEVFRTYIRRLRLERDYPGVLGIGFARRVPTEAIEAWQQEVREELPGFTVFPTPVAAPDAFVIRMLEPLHVRNAAALGFDMGSQPSRRVAMERAMATGNPALSGPVTLVQEITPDKQAGFLVYVPVYEGGAVPDTPEERQARGLGVSYAPLRAEDYFALLTRPDLPQFEVYAGVEHDPADLVYRTAPPIPDAWHIDLMLSAPASDWLVRYTSPKPPLDQGTRLIGTLGLLLSLALVYATWEAERRTLERNLHNAQEAAIARAVARVTEAGEPTPMLEELADWLLEEGLATGVEVQRDGAPLVVRGQMEGEIVEHRVADARVRVAVASPEVLGWIDRVLDQTGWVVTTATLHAQAREALARNEEALHLADVFVGVLGHDLRNPLSAIGTAAGVLRRRAKDEREQEILQRMSGSVGRMSRLIDQVLDFTRARIGGGIPVQKVPGDVTAMVKEIVDEARIANPDRQIRCEARGDARTSVDPDRLKQALSNLLGNAVQHGEEGPIEVFVEGRPEGLEITIRNEGVVPEDVLAQVFEPFRGGDGEGRLGLGMYITRMIVEAHGGQVRMESRPDLGTRVRIELPRAGARPG